MIQKKIGEPSTSIELRGMLFFFTAALVACTIFPCTVFACYVSSLDLYIARTGLGAKGHPTGTLFLPVGDHFGWHAHWTGETQNHWLIEIYDGGTRVDFEEPIPKEKTDHTHSLAYLHDYTVGDHTIKAKLLPDGPDPKSRESQPRTLTVVGVKKIECEGIESYVAPPDEVPILYVAKGAPGATITITATPDLPGSPWPEGEPTWQGATPTGGGTATFPIDTASLQYTGTTVSAWCGSSWKAMKIVVFEVELIYLLPYLYLPGSDDPTDSPSQGGDVYIEYDIWPHGLFTADSALLEIKDKNGSLVHSDSGITKSGGGDVAIWSASTNSLRSVNSEKDLYKAKVTITKGTESHSSNEDQMSVEESTVTIVPENSPTTGQPITDCMEGRSVTFTATSRGFVSTIPGNPIDFTFHYQHADGTPWSETDLSFDQVEDNTPVADNVPPGDADHHFDTPIYVEVEDNFTHSATSSTIWIRVWELWIDYFRDAATDKDWKVVVGKAIEYSAIAAPGAKNFAWDMADDTPDQWNPTGGNLRTGTNMVIPNSDLPTDNHWDYFGDAYGTVDVFCEDEEGNNHHFYSTSMSPPKKAKVFFNPSTATHPGGGSPNWFYYWKYALFGSVSSVSWNAAIEYGSTSLAAPPYAIEIGDSGNIDYATPYNHTAVFGYARPTADGKSRIDLFYTVLTHELQHRADAPFLDGVPDNDGDRLPNTEDPFPLTINGAGYAEYTGASAWLGDWEFNARAEEGVVAPVDKDWSEGGKKWQL